MDYLWTPWRYAYVSSIRQTTGCLFCDAWKEPDDRKVLILHRGEHCFVMLNAFPYTTGHVMVAPVAHVARLQAVDRAAAEEMMALLQRLEGAIRLAYKPDGLNVGMNIGAAAGAGVADHVHMHMLPRWGADTNFMTTTAETRVLPEALPTTWERLRKAWAETS